MTRRSDRRLKATAPEAERALLVGVRAGRQRDGWSLRDSLDELGELARSAGADVKGSMSQRIAKPTPVYLGSGKLQELKDRLAAGDVDTVICDDELTPTQQRNLEQALGEHTKVIDRTALILDVFGQRARSREGRLQVDLAQHEYLLPRLRGQWTHLERQRSTGLVTGGIGTRGPGETQIETDRRLIRSRIQRTRGELDNLRRHRGRYRARRRSQGLPVVGLVGYTNAGKSTLLNTLTQAGAMAEDRLFSTLDPLTRRLRLPSGRDVLLTDTVGFIRKLPMSVVAAFRATLEEIEGSAMILQVVDLSHPNAVEQTDVVDDVLNDLDLSERPRVMALNKVDLLGLDGAAHPYGRSPGWRGHLLGVEPRQLEKSFGQYHRTVLVSATAGTGLDDLLETIDLMIGQAIEAQEAATAV